MSVAVRLEDPPRGASAVARGWRRITPRPLRALAQSPAAAVLVETAFWSAAGDAISKGLMLLSMVLVARILGAQDYGRFGMVRSTFNLFAIFGGMGLGLTANRYVAQFRDTDKGLSGRIVGSSYVLAACFGLLAGGAVFAGARWIAGTFLRSPELASALRLAALLLLLSAVNGAQIGVLQGLGAYRRLAAGGAFQGVTALGAFVAGAYLFGVDGALAGFLVYAGGGVALFHALIAAETRRRRIPVSYGDLRPVLPLVWRFSVPAALTGIAVAPFKWLAETLLARGSGFQDLGVFNASMIVANLLIAAVSTINAPLISMAAGATGERSGARLQFWNLYASWYVFLAFAAPFVLAPRLPGLLFGPAYSTPQFFTVNLLLLPYCGLLLYYQGIVRILAQHGTLWLAVGTNVAEGVTLLAAFLALGRYGAPGLGAAYLLSYVVRVAVSIPLLRRSGLIPAGLVFDRWFGVSFAAFVAALLLRMGAAR